MIRGMVMVKKASAPANRELGTIQTDVADAIVAACNAIPMRAAAMDQWPIDVSPGRRRHLHQHVHQRGRRQPRPGARGASQG